jgi:hypothetical protein
VILMLILASCMKNGSVASDGNTGRIVNKEENGNEGYPHVTTNDSVQHIVNHPAFVGFGEYILPWHDNTYYYDTPLSNVRSLLPYHNHVDPDTVVDAINYLIDEINDGETAYSDEIVHEFRASRPPVGAKRR